MLWRMRRRPKSDASFGAPKHDNEAITIAPGERPVLRIGGDHCDRSSGFVAHQIASSDASDRRAVGAAMSPPQRSDR
jgi:hypothetical protein